MADSNGNESMSIQKRQNQCFHFLVVGKINGFPPEANTASEPSKFEANNGSIDLRVLKRIGTKNR